MALLNGPDDCGRRLARLLDAQVEVCGRILACSESQQRLVREHREDELLSLLGDKQKMLEEHESLSAQSQPVRAQWERDREKASPEVHALVETSWSNLRDMLDNIVRLEDASREILEGRKGEVSTDINKLQRGKIVNKAYGGGMRPPPQARYSDKQG
jgi:FlgN protein.